MNLCGVSSKVMFIYSKGQEKGFSFMSVQIAEVQGSGTFTYKVFLNSTLKIGIQTLHIQLLLKGHRESNKSMTLPQECWKGKEVCNSGKIFFGPTVLVCRTHFYICARYTLHISQ
jgi:hypothetical protein